MGQKHLDYLKSLGPIMPANVKPVYPGWYAREFFKEAGPTSWLASRDYFDGAHWFDGYARGERGRCAAFTPRHWRGLARPSYESSEMAQSMKDDQHV